MLKKWESEIIGTSLSCIVAYDTFVYSRKIIGDTKVYGPVNENSLVSISGHTGRIIESKLIAGPNSWPSDEKPIAVFKWKDTIFTILLHADTLILLDGSKNKKWEAFGFWDFIANAINISDLNLDGVPEIIIANKIISPINGAVLLEDNLLKGCNVPYKWFPIGQIPSENQHYGNSSIGDFLPSYGLELAAGNIVYEVVLNNNLSSVSNQFIQHVANAPVQNGITSSGDIDGDGELDVIVVRNQYFIDGGGIYVWNPRTGAMIARAPSGESGSVPFIGDVDGDCIPEIGVVFATELRMYKYDGSQNLVLLYSLPTTDKSGATGITMFDFNQDGRIELVYRDETTLRVIEGATGKTITSVPMLSATWMEYPIVADIDNDGQAEILTTGYMPGETERDSRVYCFESGGAPWAPARSVWNQYGYHVTNVNDDLTIPRHQQNMAQLFDTDSCAQTTCPQPYNAFMTQATYRTQKGCRVWPSILDLEVKATVDCTMDSLDICFIIKGRPDTMTFVPISCYGGGFNSAIPNDPTTRVPLETRIVQNQDTFCFKVARVISMDSMIIVINDNGNTGWNPLTPSNFTTEKIECRYDNNIFALALPKRLPNIDLGPDQSGCVGKVITLNAGEGYSTYRWSDESTDQNYTTGTSGLHWVEATDDCGLISRDTVILFISPAFSVSLGEDQKICPNDTLSLSYSEPYDQLIWLPTDRMTCDTCAVTTVVGNRDTLITLHVIRNGCISSDTISIDYVNLSQISLGPDSRLCPGLVDSFNVWVPYDSLMWSPASKVSCATCPRIKLISDQNFELSIAAYRDGCVTRDTVSIEYIKRVDQTRKINLCENEVFTYGDSTWTQSGTYSYMVGQCDSLLTFEIQSHQTPETNVSWNICAGDSIRIGNIWRKTPGQYDDILTSAVGCDSILRVSLSVLPKPNSVSLLNICSGKSVAIHGINRSIAGTYIEIFTAMNGCDSTSTVTLTVAPPISRFDSLWICQSESATIHGQAINVPGLYSKAFKTSQGCDSTSNVFLTVSPYKITDWTTSLCEGDSILINNKCITEAGIFNDTIPKSSECDEVIRNNVVLLKASVGDTTITLCPNATKIIHGQMISAPGEYVFDQLTNQAGCDSTLIVNVSAILPMIPTTLLDCENKTYTLLSDTADDWLFGDVFGPYADTLVIEKGGTINIPTYSPLGCFQYYPLALPIIPSLSDIPSIADQQQNGNAGVTVNINLSSTDWKVLWSPSAFASCDTCLITTITVDNDTTISVLLTHISGCAFEQSFRITKAETISLDIPNIFNPNSTGGNDKWSWTTPSGYSLIQASVYDRWGNQVYTGQNNSNISWDGTHLGKLVNPGVFVYIIKILDASGKVLILKGDVTVVR